MPREAEGTQGDTHRWVLDPKIKLKIKAATGLAKLAVQVSKSRLQFQEIPGNSRRAELAGIAAVPPLPKAIPRDFLALWGGHGA